MKKLICVLLALLMFSGCTSETAKTEVYMEFTDDTGYTVSLEKKPEKVAILFSSYAEVWSLAGGEIDITVSEAVERGFAKDDVILVDDKSGHTHIDTEILIANKPDFVIATADYDIQRETADICREAGIPVALFKVECYSDYLNMLDICTRITGCRGNYEVYGEAIENDIIELKALLDDIEDTQKILFVRAGSAARSTKAKTKDDNFVCQMLYELNTYNIAENAPVLLDGLSIEEIIKEDPEHIFISTMGDEDAAKEYMTSLLQEDGWSHLTAVKTGNVHFLPKDLFHYKPNQRWAEAYKYLANILYPERIHE
ncbi:MAG: ABC transporter substrate-binding protein [Clostridia bacterium]